jgi:hypothetical protein
LNVFEQAKKTKSIEELRKSVNTEEDLKAILAAIAGKVYHGDKMDNQRISRESLSETKNYNLLTNNTNKNIIEF